MKNKESIKNNEQEIRGASFYSKFASGNENQMKVLKEMDQEYSDILKEHLAKKNT